MHDFISDARKNRSFLLLDQLLVKVGMRNDVLAESVLISEGATIGENNIFYPNVVIERSGEGSVQIGDNNIFYPGTHIIATIGGIAIGDNNIFGPRACSIRANIPGSTITIGNGGRYDGADVMGETVLEDGSQILGMITVKNCHLAKGDTYRSDDPDRRGAVLKGFGTAENLRLERGEVVKGFGNFSDSPVEMQSVYHPKVKE